MRRLFDFTPIYWPLVPDVTPAEAAPDMGSTGLWE
jgi:hypothetical protein